ncbi:MAG: hypothetical protein FWB95_00995 [Treponema sp.]|nr:hypothetical protein [Treponema sp.]
MLKKIILITSICILIIGHAWAQDFGFGSPDEDETPSKLGALIPPVSLGGEISAGVIGYLNEMSEGAGHINTREMFMLSGKLKFSAQSSFAEGVIKIKLIPAIIPVSIDEAYIGAFFKGFDISAGLKKVTWGKADQFGPLDIINLPDQSKLFIEMADNSNLMDVKVANPVIHASYRFGQFSKVECVFLPSFEVVSMAVSSALTGDSNPMSALLIGSTSERWIPEKMKDLAKLIPQSEKGLKCETSGLDYAQAGLRYTTSINSIDIGAQYFYGRMFQPAVRVNLNPMDPNNPVGPSIENVEILFNKYHQIGLDYAQVLAGFNIRAEVAANITEDLNGDYGYIYNPSIGWSLGFDRDLIFGININLQANGTIRLFDDKVSSANIFDSNFDNEAGASMTSTRITSMLSKKFLRDELELRTAVVWGIDSEDCVIIPSLIWIKDSLRAALSGGFFLGDTEGQLGQYKNNNFLKVSLAYSF